MLLAQGSPWPTLTLLVPLAAIFLSTLELLLNTELTRAIERATVDLHKAVVEITHHELEQPQRPDGMAIYSRSPGATRPSPESFGELLRRLNLRPEISVQGIDRNRFLVRAAHGCAGALASSRAT